MRISFTILAGLLVALPLAAQTPYSFDFSSVNSSQIRFDGDADTFQFVPEGLDSIDFQIDDSDGGYLTGLFGRIEGTFLIDAPSLQTAASGKVEWASVSGAGLFEILDGAGGVFSAALDFEEIYTIEPTEFASGGILTGGTVNLFNLAFAQGAGSNTFTSRLAALALSGPGILTASFDFIPSRSISDLIAEGALNDSSYSGEAYLPSVGANIPEPSTYAAALALAGLVSTAWLRRRRAG